VSRPGQQRPRDAAHDRGSDGDGGSSGRVRAAIGSATFLVAAPGAVAGLGPWLITDWASRDWSPPIRVAGGGLIAAGAFVLAHAFIRFVVEGIGTPAPLAPTERLVIGGAYRYVRNPMYLAVLAIIAGQSLLLGQPGLLLYAGIVALAFVTFVSAYEEPTLARRYGEQYRAYTRAVPAWLPRTTPWPQRAPDEHDHRPRLS
jgi:protein-S-isoprenylcysteine O-methyltransferase Ste14